MGELDEVSRSIGLLQGKVESVESSQKAIFEKLETIHAEQTNQKVHTAKLSGKVGFVTAIVTYGLFEGMRLYIRSNGGN